MGWNDTAAQAKKILGDKADIPKDLPPAAIKPIVASRAVASKYAVAVKQMEAAVLAAQDSNSSITNALKQFSNVIAKSNFGMDTKADDYKKKRGDAQKLFDKYFDDATKSLQSESKDLDELDKHMTSLSDYKSPPAPS